MNESTQMRYFEQRKTPAVAILLSFIIPGAGQIYNGEAGKGIGMIIAYIICWAASALVLPIFILIGLWIWGMIDANTVAKNFNSALMKRIDDEDTSSQKIAEQQAEIKATTISSNEFVTLIEKNFKLFQNKLLSDTEFESKKKEAISLLTTKKIVEAPEDFLTAVIPLIQKNALTEQEITQIKAIVL